MMSGERSYEIPLPDGGAIRIRRTSERGRILAFTVQYEIPVGEDNFPIVRYDAAHGFAHRDLLDWQGNVIEKRAMPSWMSFNDALTSAEEDLKTNAATYRAAFLRNRS
jgi:hypothetical protein